MLWIWQNIRLDLPDEWEMLRFGIDPESGKSLFADRYQVRLELGWEPAWKVPDFDRVMGREVKRMKKEKSMESTARKDVAGWKGFVGRTAHGECSRFSKWFEGEKKVVELVLHWPDERDATLEQRILDSAGMEPPHHNGLRRWKAWGMDLLADEGLSLEGASIQPASVKAVFSAGKKSPVREEYRRLGFVNRWLRREVRDWLQRRIPREFTQSAEDEVFVEGHQIAVLRAEKPARGLARLRGKMLYFCAAAWICPHDERLYFAAVSGREPLEARILAEKRLSCCDRLPLR